MHQSPQKYLARRRDKYSSFDLTENQPDRVRHRESQPQARKFQPRDESPRKDRRDGWDKQSPDR